MERPRYVTKFVNPAFLEATKSGFLKFGSLSEYSQSEGDAESRLTDREEGSWSRSTSDRLVGFSGSIGGITLTNVSADPGRLGTIMVGKRFQALVFCSSVGPYDASVHEEILSAGNGSVTSFVVFDTQKLLVAMKRFFDIARPIGGRIYDGRVEYTRRRKDTRQSIDELKDSLSSNAYAEDFEGAVFIKPERFEHEREYRFAVVLDGAQEATRPIFVRDAASQTARFFADAVTDFGGPI